MDIRKITDTYFVAPQINPEDMQAIADAGIVAVICNRPDAEIPQTHHASLMRQSAQDAGLAFLELPLTHQTFTPENIGRQRSFLDAAEGPVLAYCASGTRSSIAWAFGQAGDVPTSKILGLARQAGYELSHLEGAIDAAANTG